MDLLNRLPIPIRFTQTLDFSSPLRIMQIHKQIAFRNQNVEGYIRNLISSIDREVLRQVLSFNKSR